VITSLDQVTEFPLCWPETKPRAASRRPGYFQVAHAKAQADLERELQAWRVRRWVLSMAPRYRGTAGDPGVALWFYMPSKTPIPTRADLRVLACDRHLLLEHNLRAIGLTLEALRAVDRYGAYSIEQAVEGAKALPPPPGADGIDWRQVFGAVQAGLPNDDALAIVNARYRRLAADANNDQDELRRLNLAIEAARRDLK